MKRLGALIAGGLVFLACLVPTAEVGSMVGVMVLAWSRQLAVLVAGIAVVALVRRRWMPAAVSVVAAAVAILPWMDVAPTTAESVAPACLTVVSVNAFERNQMPADVIARALAESNADVLAIVEPRVGLIASIAPLLPNHRVAVHHDAHGKFDLAILTRTPTIAARLHRLERSVTAEVEVPCGASTVRIFAVHLPAPTSLGQQRARRAIDARVFAQSRVVVTGDFNAVPPDPLLERLSAQASLVRYDTGPTWPRRIEQIPVGRWGLALGIPIDHVLARDVGVRDVERFFLPGSDHVGHRFGVTLTP